MEFIHFFLISFLLFMGYYLFMVVKKPKVITGNKKIEKFLKTQVNVINQKYFPSLFHWESRLQSILGLTRRITTPDRLPYRREIFKLSDSGELGLDYLEPESIGIQKDSKQKQTVLLLPGLTNSSQTSYVKTLALSIVSSGSSLIVFNNRGLGGVPLTTPKTYAASKYEDLKEVLQFLHKQQNGDKIIVIGTSLGGMMLCQYLINNQEESKKIISNVMLISVVFDAFAGIRNIEKPGFNYIVNSGMAASLKGLAKRHQKTLELRPNCCWDFNKILGSKTLREFDTNFTAPQFGYNSVWDYYKDCTIVDYVDKFAIPVFALNAMDDPMQPGEYLPFSGAENKDSKLAFIVTNRGGHLGFLEGILPTKKSFHFSERLVLDWLQALESHSYEVL